MVRLVPEGAASTTRAPPLVVTAIRAAGTDAGAGAAADVCAGRAGGGAERRSAGRSQAAISSTSAKDFHISLRFLFHIEVFDHRGLGARAEGAERGGVDCGGGHDGATAIV